MSLKEKCFSPEPNGVSLRGSLRKLLNSVNHSFFFLPVSPLYLYLTKILFYNLIYNLLPFAPIAHLPYCSSPDHIQGLGVSGSVIFHCSHSAILWPWTALSIFICFTFFLVQVVTSSKDPLNLHYDLDIFFSVYIFL